MSNYFPDIRTTSLCQAEPAFTSLHPETLGLEYIASEAAYGARHRRLEALGTGHVGATAPHELALEGVQNRIASFSGAQRRAFDDYIGANAPPVDRAIQWTRAGRSWSKWLGHESVASKKALGQILEWHVGQVQTLQSSPEVEQAIDEVKSRFKAIVKVGIETGRLSQLAEEIFTRVDQTDVLIADLFDPGLNDGDHDGYAPYEYDQVVVAGQFAGRPDSWSQSTGNNIKRVLLHEFGHRPLSTGMNRGGLLHHASFEELGADMLTAMTSDTSRNDIASEAAYGARHRRLEALGTGHVGATAPHELALEGVQNRIASFSGAQRRAFDDYIGANAPPVDRAIQWTRAGRSWSKWLGHESVASKKALGQILEWHVGQVQTLQSSPEVEQAIDEVKSRFKAIVKVGIETGRLSQLAEEIFTRVDQTDVLIADLFDPGLNDGDHDGYAPYEYDQVVVAGQFAGRPDSWSQSTGNNIKRVLLHEFGHRPLSTGMNRGGLLHHASFEELGADMLTAMTSDTSRNDITVQFYSGIGIAFEAFRRGPFGEVEARKYSVAYSGSADEKQSLRDEHDAAWRQPNAFQIFYDAFDRRTAAIKIKCPGICLSELDQKVGRSMVDHISYMRYCELKNASILSPVTKKVGSRADQM